MNIQIKNIPDCLTDLEEIESQLHAHDYYQLMWFWHGIGNHHIDFNDEQVSPYKVFVVSPGQLHQFKDLEDPEGIIIQFDESFFSHMDNNLDTIIKYSVFNAFHRPPYYVIDDETGMRLRGISNEIKRECQNKEKFAHENYLYNLVKMFLIIIIREGLRTDHKHIYNNYYDVAADSAYQSSYCIGARNESRITAENNYFGSGIKNTVSGHASKQGSLYLSRNIDNSSKGAKEGQFIPLSSPAFDVPYQYNPIASENVADFCKQSAGSDVLSVAR